MTDTDVVWWSSFWTQVEHWAFLGVVLTLAIEFAALKLGEPYKKKLDDAKDVKIAELNKETAQLRKQMGPRQIDGEAFKKYLEGKPKPPAPTEIMFPREDGEAYSLSTRIRDILRILSWKREPTPVPAR